ncbi:MAG TPA: hypothetical protein VNT20_22510 [Flavisolibacter sp.]|jgi:hypothetical protein|nr:hypothetical protein [Flavisolibacter sp.]
MARQRGPVPFVGRIGDISFYEDKVHGYLSRQKGGPSKQQIKKRKSMAVVRQNNNEFGKASGYGRLLRNAFRPLILHCKEYSMSRRLQSLLTLIIKMDTSKEPGKRELVKAHLTELQDFELNDHLSYLKFFKKGVDIEVHKKGITTKGFCILSKVIAKKADHFKVISVAASVNFAEKKFLNDVQERTVLPLTTKTFVFEHEMPATEHLFYGLAVCFYKKNGKKFDLVLDEEMKAGFISFVE